MNLENLLRAAVICNDHDITFFADTNSAADAVHNLATRMGVEGKIVKTAICQTVTIVFGFLYAGN